MKTEEFVNEWHKATMSVRATPGKPAQRILIILKTGAKIWAQRYSIFGIRKMDKDSAIEYEQIELQSLVENIIITVATVDVNEIEEVR